MIKIQQLQLYKIILMQINRIKFKSMIKCYSLTVTVSVSIAVLEY